MMKFTVVWGMSSPCWGVIVRRQLSFLRYVLRKHELKKLVVTLLTENEPEADNERPFSLT